MLSPRPTGWRFTKISKIEHGSQPPSENDLRVWCRHCDAEEQILDLIATVRSIESMYVEWRRSLSTGMKRLQRADIPLYRRTKLFRMYEPALVPVSFRPGTMPPRSAGRNHRVPRNSQRPR